MAERKNAKKTASTVIANPAVEVSASAAESATDKTETKQSKEKITMTQQALGMIETRGLVAAIEAAEARHKAGTVHLVGTEKMCC